MIWLKDTKWGEQPVVLESSVPIELKAIGFLTKPAVIGAAIGLACAQADFDADGNTWRADESWGTESRLLIGVSEKPGSPIRPAFLTGGVSFKSFSFKEGPDNEQDLWVTGEAKIQIITDKAFNNTTFKTTPPDNPFKYSWFFLLDQS
jgi:hypothetical protein